MIITVTPNPALDITYAVPRLRVGESHRVSVTGRHAAGKGLNVAGVLASMGIGHIAVAPLGPERLDFFIEDAAQRSITLRTVDTSVPMRRSVTIYSADGVATVLNEQGRAHPEGTWTAMIECIGAICSPGDVLAISGSLPPGTDDSVLVAVCATAIAAGAEVVIDGRGPWIAEVLRVSSALCKPNAREATSMTGISDPLLSARELVRRGAWAALVTRGADGLVLVTEQGEEFQARPPTVDRGNATGAGDALTAAVCAVLDGCGRDVDWPTLLHQAVAWSVAAVRQSAVGLIDRVDVETIMPKVIVEQLR